MDNKISVIVPVYNLENYIEKTVESILNQTYNNIEVILVDDGSTDNSSDIIDRIAAKDSRVKVIHKENEGVTIARLYGVKISTGDLIGFVDGDDIIEPDMYERLVNNALKYDADISHCGYQMVFEDGRVNFFHNTGEIECLSRDDSLKELLSGEKIEPGLCNKLYRKSLFAQLMTEDKMDHSIKINEDLLMNFLLFSYSENTVFDDFCPYHYIVRRSSASRQRLNQNKIYDPIKVKEFILDASDEKIKPYAEKAFISTVINVYNSLVCEKLNEYESDKLNVRNTIKKNKDKIRFLGSKQKLLAKIIVCCPWVYPFVYRIYKRFIQKDPYN